MRLLWLLCGGSGGLLCGGCVHKGLVLSAAFRLWEAHNAVFFGYLVFRSPIPFGKGVLIVIDIALFGKLPLILANCVPPVFFIKDRFFNSASATPSLVFPSLINLAQKHLAKLNEGQRIALDKSIGELSDKLGETFPKQLMLAEQGAFQLGYYQQRQEYFKKKADTTEQKEEA